MDEVVVRYHMISRIPHFSLFKVIYGCFSSWHHRSDLDVHHLQPSARSGQDTLENDTSGGTNTLHSVTNAAAVEDAERKSMSQCELTTHTCPPCLR